MKIYLAGPINGTTDAEAHGWRERAEALLMFETEGEVEFCDPMVRDYRGIEGAFVGDIVSGDLADISAADGVLAYCWKPSYGTAMELVYASQWGKRVVAVLPEGPVSPWLAWHADAVVRSLEEGVSALLRQSLH